MPVEPSDLEDRVGGSSAVLRELSVQNLALIEDVRVELQARLLRLDGRDGGGQEPAADGAGAGAGRQGVGRAGPRGQGRGPGGGRLRGRPTPALRAEVEAILGGPLDDDQLILTRRISAQGRGSAHVNGLPVTVATLQALGERLIDIHGQHEGRALLDPDRQRGLLDAYGGLEEPLGGLPPARDGARRAAAQAARADPGRPTTAQRERALLEFERDELAAADPRPGEYDELAREAHRLANAEQLRDGRGRGLRPALRGRPLGAGAARSGSRGRSSRWPRRSPSSPTPSADLERLADETREVAYSLRDLGHDWDDDPARLEEVEARLALYRRLAARFHCTPDELAARRADDRGAARRDRAGRGRPARPRRPAGRGLGRAEARPPPALSAARRKTCKAFAQAIQGRLKPLGLDGARLDGRGRRRSRSATTRPPPPPPESGVDRVEMLFSANPGEEPPAAPQDRLGRRAVAGDAGRQDRAGRRRPRPDARLRRDRHRRRRPARRGPGQDPRRAGPAPPGHLRDPPAPDGQLRPPPVGHPQADRARPDPDHDHPARRRRARRRARRDAPRRLGRRGDPARGARDAEGSQAVR